MQLRRFPKPWSQRAMNTDGVNYDIRLQINPPSPPPSRSSPEKGSSSQPQRQTLPIRRWKKKTGFCALTTWQPWNTWPPLQKGVGRGSVTYLSSNVHQSLVHDIKATQLVSSCSVWKLVLARRTGTGRWQGRILTTPHAHFVPELPSTSKKGLEYIILHQRWYPSSAWQGTEICARGGGGGWEGCHTPQVPVTREERRPHTRAIHQPTHVSM